MPEWLEQARHASERHAVLTEIDRRIKQDLNGSVLWLRDLFFQAETETLLRRDLALRIGRSRHKQLFNLVLGHFLLGGEPDRIALAMALGEFAEPTTVPPLIERWTEADLQERLAIMKALENMPIPQTLEFFSQVFNGERVIPGDPDAEQIRLIRKAAGDALSRHITF